MVRSICVYCGASSRVDDSYKEAAKRLGRIIGERGLTLVYGGGRVGLMGIVADAALEHGGRAIGIIPDHLQANEVEHTGLSELLIVDTMHTRKRLMVEKSDAFVVLPGGFGTLDETFEILTWRQLGLHDKPIIIVNQEGFWDPMLAMIEHQISEGFIKPIHRRLYQVVEDVADVPAALDAAPAPAYETDSSLI